MRLLAVLALSAATSLQAADPALLNLVMPDATVLAGINVQKAKTSAIGQFLLTQLPAGGSMEGFAGATGFDPRQDITEILMASSGNSKNHGLILASGNFDASKIAAFAGAQKDHAVQEYKGAQMIASTNPKDTNAIAFLSSKIAMIGDVESVKAAIDRSGGANAIDPALAAKAASFAAADLWSATTKPIQMNSADAAGADANANNPFAGVLKTVLQASGSIVLTSPIQLSAEAQTASDQDATSLSDVLKFVVMMVQGNGQTSLMNSLNISTDHNTVKIQLSIPEDQLEQMIQGASSDKKKTVGTHV